MFLEVIGTVSCVVVVGGAVALIKFLNDSNNILRAQKLEAEEKLRAYKETLHDFADAMHNIGEIPLKNKEDAYKVELSYEEATNIRSLMRTLRRLARSDMAKDPRTNIPYAEIVTLLNDVAQYNRNPNISSDLIAKIENEASNENYDAIREIAKAMQI